MNKHRFTGEPLNLTEEQWKARLNPEQFHVLRQKGTEPPFNNRYFKNRESGLYRCAGCQTPLFSSTTQYDSGTGWPSFWEPICLENVCFEEDHQLGSVRVEVLCSCCHGHLGHVFKDGPLPTHTRYCMNSSALLFTTD